MSRLCTICARGGSKGMPGKNLRDLCGKPLIAHTIEQARQCNLFEHIAVSSDCNEILNVADRYGADILVKRPNFMATDTAPKCPAIKHCLEMAEDQKHNRFETVVELQATSPIRLPEDIVGAVKLLEQSRATNVVSGTEARNSPYYTLVERDSLGFIHHSKTLASPFARRQDAPKCFQINGSIYVWRREPFLKNPMVLYENTLLYEMPPERSVDIDGQFDFDIAEMLMRRGLAHETLLSGS
jgi:N-acylneuraminate cytidylyltransferase/CMP-N,N'-diacetyllegionaminic acid synthase